MLKFSWKPLGFVLLGAFACGNSSGSGVDVDASQNDVDSGPLPELCEPACEMGSSCVGDSCCEDTQVCGDSCCGSDAVCSFGQCLVPGADCLDPSDCSDNEYCELTLGEDPGEVPAMCVGGTAPNPGRCLPRPPICPDGQMPTDPTSCLVSCEYRPPASAFLPELKYSWGSPDAPNNEDSVMMTPIVIQLDDDNCDGVVNERDIPEIVFSTFTGGVYQRNGTLHAISIVEGVVVEKWSVNDATIRPGVSIAGGNIDGLPGNEIIVCTTAGQTRAYGADGIELWTSTAVGCAMPSLADLDQDGSVEVIVNRRVLDGVTGNVKFITPIPGPFVVVDVTGDGILNLVSPQGVVDFAGNLVTPYLLSNGETPSGYIAVADLDNDGVPEIILANKENHMLHIWNLDSTAPNGVRRIRDFVDVNGMLDVTDCAENSSGRTTGGGPPTVADVNGDGFPDVTLAGGVGYTVFDGQMLTNPVVSNPSTILWARETTDCSSAKTGSSVFDFNGDGRAEVVYGDQEYLRVYDGLTGDTLFETCNTNGTLEEYPVIADVDNDGRADIVAVSNSYGGSNCNGVKTSGVRIFSSAQDDWVRTRRVWNQHAYHVTNVSESGEIPRIEAANHLDPKLNNFRLNVQPEGEFSAPDLRVEILPGCASDGSLTVRVRNFGETAAPMGIPLTLYARDGAMALVLVDGGPYATTRPLYPAEAEDILIVPSTPIANNMMVQAIVDENPNHSWQECNLDNNSSEEVFVGCQVD